MLYDVTLEFQSQKIEGALNLWNIRTKFIFVLTKLKHVLQIVRVLKFYVYCFV